MTTVSETAQFLKSRTEANGTALTVISRIEFTHRVSGVRSSHRPPAPSIASTLSYLISWSHSGADGTLVPAVGMQNSNAQSIHPR